MKWVKTREKLAATAAIIFVVLMAVYIAAVYGIRIPLLTDAMRWMMGW